MTGRLGSVPESCEILKSRKVLVVMLHPLKFSVDRVPIRFAWCTQASVRNRTRLCTYGTTRIARRLESHDIKAELTFEFDLLASDQDKASFHPHSPAPMAAKLDLAERASYVSSTTMNKDLDGGYAKAATPDIEGGALRSGEIPQLLSRQSFGLLAQYAAVGLIYGTLPSIVYPFLTAYLNMEGSATVSATALLTILWSLKVFVGMVTDNFPIFGYRRRPYMMLGWSLCAICLFTMAVMPMPHPYFIKPEYRKLKVLELVDGVHVRESAPDAGAKYIVLMMLASLGYVVADVAADGVLVEYAQREPEAIRGRTQASIYATRNTFMIVSNVILAFGMNGKEYGGDWNKGMSFASVVLLLAIFCLPIIAITWFFVEEDRFERPNFKAYLNTLWEAI